MAAGQVLAVKIEFALGSSAVRLCHPLELPKARILSHGGSGHLRLGPFAARQIRRSGYLD